MFNKLRMKLTLINIVVIGSIMVLLFLFRFSHSSNSNSNDLYNELWQVAVSKDYSTLNGSFLTYNHIEDISCVILDSNGTITKKYRTNISDEDLDKLIRLILVNKDLYGEIRLNDNNSYMFLKVYLDKQKGITIAFRDSLGTFEIIASYISRSAFTIIVSLIFIFFGSLFISDKALVPIKRAWLRQIDFAADASHELRSPITVIQTNLELVMGNPEETVHSQNKWLENIDIENKRMATLIDDLLTLSRADTNEQVLNMSSFMIDEALSQAVNPYKPVASSKEIKLNVTLEYGLDFYGDQNRIKQLIIIFLDNALKSTNSFGHVDIELKQRDKWVQITIKDTGEGIEQKHLDKIFERFYRIDKARSREKGGSGLGLSIAKWIVDEHKGSITVESIVEKGTTFTILLPIYAPGKLN